MEIKKAVKLIKKLKKLDLIDYIPDPIPSGDYWIYTIYLK